MYLLPDMAALADVALFVALTGAVVVIVAGVWLRAQPAWAERHPKLTAACAALAMLAGGAAYFWLVVSQVPRLPRDPLLAGALIGLIFGGTAPAMALPVIALLAAVERGPFPRIADPWLMAWMSLATALGCVVGGILLLQFIGLLRFAGALGLLLVPLGVALFPLARQLFWAPALLVALRRRQGHLEPACAPALRDWTRDIATTYRLGKIEVLFGPARHKNAAAIGFWPLTRFIMIGDGLTAAMPEREVRAILAHEMAHVLRADVRNQLLLWIALASLWVYISSAVRISLGLHGPFWAAMSGAGSVVALVIAGRYSRYSELATDRLAAELTDDADGMAAALTRLAEITKTPPHQRFPTHPSLNERLENLRASTAATPTG